MEYEEKNKLKIKTAENWNEINVIQIRMKLLVMGRVCQGNSEVLFVPSYSL